MTLFEQRPIRPMLSSSGEPFDSTEYLFEPKWDGLRAILFIKNSVVELQNRNLRNVTGAYPELQGLAKRIDASAAIIDGEVVVLDKHGLPNFQLLQPRFGLNDTTETANLAKTCPVTYVAFDLLHLDGEDLLQTGLEARKNKLKRIIHENPYLLYSDHVKTHGRKFFTLAHKKGLEGIVAKKRDSPYIPGERSSTWVKMKSVRTIECIIAGYTAGEGARLSTFGSLVLGAYQKDGNIRHVGNVGGGFSNHTLTALTARLAKLETKTPVIKGKVESNTPITWVKPKLVCEVQYATMTDDEKLRFPRFKRLRTDIPPGSIQL